MNTLCPRPQCSSHSLSDPKASRVVRNGFFRRKSDFERVQRFLCRVCSAEFSHATLTLERYQKKRMINAPLFELHCSGTSQRRLARFFRVNQKTIVRKVRLL